MRTQPLERVFFSLIPTGPAGEAFSSYAADLTTRFAKALDVGMNPHCGVDPNGFNPHLFYSSPLGGFIKDGPAKEFVAGFLANLYKKLLELDATSCDMGGAGLFSEKGSFKIKVTPEEQMVVGWLAPPTQGSSRYIIKGSIPKPQFLIRTLIDCSRDLGVIIPEPSFHTILDFTLCRVEVAHDRADVIAFCKEEQMSKRMPTDPFDCHLALVRPDEHGRIQRPDQVTIIAPR